jgi:hypothetical protein
MASCPAGQDTLDHTIQFIDSDENGLGQVEMAHFTTDFMNVQNAARHKTRICSSVVTRLYWP